MNLTAIQLAVLLVSMCGAVAAAEPKQVLSVAVFDFESRDEAVRDLGPKVGSLVSANLSADPGIITVERPELEKILGEQELGLSGTVTPGSAAKVGHLTGAKVLVTGRVMKADKELVLVAKVIGTETSRVHGEIVKGAATSPLTDLAAELARKIASIIREKGDTLVAKAATRVSRVEELKKQTKGKHLPSISIKVSEQHFGQPVIDPAAETELGLILKDCGFTILDTKSSTRPDIEITGEAFSTVGLRKGNLVSCKARVEIKAVANGGRVLAVDRQTAITVDIAEQIAAKTALQEAAAEIAERLVPSLAQ